MSGIIKKSKAPAFLIISGEGNVVGNAPTIDLAKAEAKLAAWKNQGIPHGIFQYVIGSEVLEKKSKPEPKERSLSS